MTVFTSDIAMVCCVAIAIISILGMYYFSYKENKKVRAFFIILFGIFGLGSTYWLSSIWVA